MSAIFEHKKLVADSQDLEFVYELLIEIVDYVAVCLAIYVNIYFF